MATRLNKFEGYVVNALGLPVPNVSVEVRREGATVVSGGPTVFTIENPGAIRHSSEVGTPSDDSVTAYTAAGLVRDASIRGVSALSATSITVATGFTGVVDDDRLSPTTNLPTLYEDSEGTETKTNPLTTNASGYFYGWIAANVVDALVSGGDAPNGPITTRLLIGQICGSGNIIVINAWGTGTQTFSYIDTLRDMVSGDKLLSLRERGSELAYFDHTGKLFLPGLQSSAAMRITSGGLDVDAGGINVDAGGITVVGNSLITGTLGNLTGLTMTSGDFVTSGGTSTLRAARLNIDRGTAHTSSDWVLGGNWGTSPINFDSSPNCRDAAGVYVVTSGSGSPGANPTVTLTFKDGVMPSQRFAVCNRTETNSPTTAYWLLTGGSSSTAVFTFVGTPAASTSYGLAYIFVSR